MILSELEENKTQTTLRVVGFSIGKCENTDSRLIIQEFLRSIYKGVELYFLEISQALQLR